MNSRSLYYKRAQFEQNASNDMACERRIADTNMYTSHCLMYQKYTIVVGKRMTVVPLYFNPRCDEDDNRISHKGCCGATLSWYY